VIREQSRLGMDDKVKQVLFVDDEPGFLAQVQSLMSHYAGPAWSIHTAPSAGKALVQLQEHAFDLLVLDINMPVVDGVQLLGLVQRRFPNLIKVGLTGETDEKRRAACLNAGAELCLEKPRMVGGWEGIFTTLDGLMQMHPEEGFRGVLRKVSLQDLIQMECLSRNSSVLEITASGRRGRIFVENGQIIHAEDGRLAGIGVFNKLLSLAGGSFQVKPFTAPPARSISGSWEFLLMEAAQKRDEAQGDQETAAPAEAPAEAVAALHEDSAPGELDAPRSAGTSRPKIEEVMICSLQGEVLLEWQCPDERGRLSLFEFITQRAKLMNVNLPLGQLERLEASDDRERAICRILEDRAMLTRTSYSIVNPPEPPGPA
jgi:CheY-like chemotaxis protein